MSVLANKLHKNRYNPFACTFWDRHICRCSHVFCKWNIDVSCIHPTRAWGIVQPALDGSRDNGRILSHSHALPCILYKQNMDDQSFSPCETNIILSIVYPTYIVVGWHLFVAVHRIYILTEFKYGQGSINNLIQWSGLNP